MKMDRVTEPDTLSIAVVIASLGRPELLMQICHLMERQTLQPDLLLFSVVSESDVPPGLEQNERLQVLMGSKGLTLQRNRALDWIGDRYDIVVFYDDDFLPSSTSIAGIEKFFRTHPDVVGATGKTVADGISGPGISYADGLRRLEKYEAEHLELNCIVASLDGLYGCNMAYRASAIGDTRFDERLKLYAWQEDIDFAASLRPRGRVVRTFSFAGVHQGVKLGRTSGLKLGYSQIVNPVYLVKKGTMRRGFAANLIVRNFLANHIKALKPEPWVDRIGRVKGNWIGLIDVLRGSVTPERIEHL